MAHQLDQFLNVLESLPDQAKRMLRSIGKLDEKAAAAFSQASQLIGEYNREKGDRPLDEQRQRKEEIRLLFQQAIKWKNAKVRIAKQLDELMTSRINQLDRRAARFESYVEKMIKTSKDGRRCFVACQDGRRRGQVDGGLALEIGSSASKKKKTAGEHGVPGDVSGFPLMVDLADMSGAALVQLMVENGVNVMDIPIDPDEPVYCTCRQVSYGAMIACDNPGCPLEWYHFGCVGVTMVPKGSWFCPQCKTAKKKKAAPKRKEAEKKKACEELEVAEKDGAPKK